jgi:hypothetical protein
LHGRTRQAYARTRNSLVLNEMWFFGSFERYAHSMGVLRFIRDARQNLVNATARSSKAQAPEKRLPLIGHEVLAAAARRRRQRERTS